MRKAAAITELLHACRAGDEAAFDEVVDLVYADLHRLARRQLRSSGRTPTLDTTALVHEAYLKLADYPGIAYADRAHFFAVAARAMRQILVDYARSQRREKRGGGARRVELDEGAVGFEVEVEKLLAVDQALSRLQDEAPRQVRVVECRYFAGLSEQETASALGVSRITVQRDWSQAKAWLREALAGGAG